MSHTRHVKLSILMPSYNEDATVVSAVHAILKQAYPCPVELVVVDDGSITPVKDLLAGLIDPRLVLIRHATNLGKGAALRQAAAVATGTHMVPFDADLEYDPADLLAMLAPVIGGRCDIVYGTRLFGANTRFQSYHHGLANKFLTLAANVMYNVYLNDLHTCLKLMPLELFRNFPLRETGFGLDTEITAQILRAGHRPFEVPVSYHSRSREQGKKISWRDGVDCLAILARIRSGPVRVGAPVSTSAFASDTPSTKARRAQRLRQVPMRLRSVTDGPPSGHDGAERDPRVAVR
jgi:dolichol-phosphate hexosyltransferase